ncbi:hypothetical protein HSE3_gp110 [Bacillus phage vB_BceM-HSE3]|nr:hypothetical protein HSE3_gp110 [Bacillus phage vB_BceM-HSE3]
MAKKVTTLETLTNEINTKLSMTGLHVSDVIVNAVLSQLLTDIKVAIRNGEEYPLPGLGTVQPSVRKVSTVFGNKFPYTAKAKLDLNNDLKSQIVHSIIHEPQSARNFGLDPVKLSEYRNMEEN